MSRLETDVHSADKVREWLREARHSKAEPLVHGSDENYRQPCKL